MVRVTDLPVRWPREHHAVAINCHVRADVSMLAGDQILQAMLPSGKARHAYELRRFAHEVSEGDVLIAVHARYQSVLVGEVIGPYEFRPHMRPNEPHQRSVRWLEETTKAEIDGRGLYRPSLGQVYAVGRLETRIP